MNRFASWVLLVFAWLAAGAAAADPIKLFTPRTLEASVASAYARAYTKRHTFANITTAGAGAIAAGQAQAKPLELEIPLPNGQSLQLKEASRRQVLAGTSVVTFDVAGGPGGKATLAITNGFVHGTIHTDAHDAYRIANVADDLYAIEELDHSLFPECGNTHAQNVTGAAQPAATASAEADDGSVIRLLVVYTQLAENYAGSPANMSSIIATAAADMNTGFAVSGVNSSVQVAHTAKVTYVENAAGITDVFGTALDRVTNGGDGFMDEVHTLRNTHQADLVVLLIRDSQYCGLGWRPSNHSTANANLGFSVTDVSCATGNLSFAHEIGHNMGANHDAWVDNSTVPYPWARGYVNTTAKIRSIMAYNNNCADLGFNCTRVNHWATADRLYNNNTIGTSNARDRDALNLSLPSIANYRTTTAQSYSLTVTKAGVGAGTVTRTGGSLNCGSTCTESGIASGTSVTLVAAPAAGSTFLGWTGACTGTGNCTFNVNSDSAVIATFGLGNLITTTPLNVTNLTGALNSETRYSFAVPANATNLKFVMGGGTGDADLYVRFGAAPTLATWDFRPYLPGSAETVTVATPAAGTWHVMVHGFAAFTGVNLVVTYETPGTPKMPALINILNMLLK